MKTFLKRNCRKRGIALIIVMIVIVMLAVLAGGFAYSMKVETRLARNTSFDPDLESLGRSGIEHARWVLAEQLRDPDPKQRAYTGRQQKWAGGPANTNEPLVYVERTVELEPGKIFTWDAFDMESKFNLSNIRDERFSPVLQRALEMIGADGVQVTDIVESYLDWVDPDDNKRTQGAETDFYLNLNPAAPYVAKNGLMDDVSELLLIRGMTPEIYFGAKRVGTMPRFNATKNSAPIGQAPTATGGVDVGLMDLFTTISGAGMAVNVNTASAEVLQLVPGMDAQLAQSIVETREIEPFLRPGELINVPGMTPELLNALQRFLVVNSSIFQIVVEARIGGQARWFEALVHRRNVNEVTILYFRVL